MSRSLSFLSLTSSTTATTDANGQAATRLTLGSESETNTVTATVAGLGPVTFTATAAEQAMPHSLEKVCGDDQEGTAGAPLTELLVVSVADEDGTAIAGVVVSFAGGNAVVRYGHYRCQRPGCDSANAGQQVGDQHGFGHCCGAGVGDLYRYRARGPLC
ncbi:MAG: hypothetical protein OXM01_13215 [Gemmatimonadota bacterium]|nr:hypothetical protein [Gemmatimonadota bacterium]